MCVCVCVCVRVRVRVHVYVCVCFTEAPPPPPPFTGPLARPDPCHHSPYKHFPLPRPGRETGPNQGEREREKERKKGRGGSRLPKPLISPRMQIPFVQLLNIALCKATASEMPV